MVLNIIYFIGGFLLGGGIVYACVRYVGIKMIERMNEGMSDYAKQEVNDAINDVAFKKKNKP